MRSLAGDVIKQAFSQQTDENYIAACMPPFVVASSKVA